MCQRREIAARADRALAGHDRGNAAIEDLDQQLQRVRLDSGVPGRERTDSQDAGRANELLAQRIARSGGVAAYEVALKRVDVGSVDDDVRHPAEPGRDAINGRAGFEMALDARARRGNARLRVGRYRYAREADRDRFDLLERQMAAVELDDSILRDSGH